MSGWNILYQNVWDLNIFRIQQILGDKKIIRSKIFWNYFGIKNFLDPNFFVHQNLAQPKSRVWHSQPSLLETFFGKLILSSHSTQIQGEYALSITLLAKLRGLFLAG